ncbi:hypothetical protein QQ045_006005 [Rhodiola kirilowii]
MLNVVLDKKEIIPPYIGMVFGSTDQVLRHCHEYGQANGFQIRIRSSERIKGTSTTNEVVIERNSHIEDFINCTRLRLVCSKEGKFKSKSNNPQRATNTTVTGCQFKDTDENGSLKNVFWADGRSRAAYKDFGDVVHLILLTYQIGIGCQLLLSSVSIIMVNPYFLDVHC